MEVTPVNLRAAARGREEQWSPGVVARLNGQFVKVARIEGEFVWHAHDDEDEAFLVLEGTLVIRMEAGDVTLHSGDLYVVPKGVRHRPVAEKECLIALIEPIGTEHTGDVVTERTRSITEQLGGVPPSSDGSD